MEASFLNQRTFPSGSSFAIAFLNVTDPVMDGLWDGDKVRVLLLLDVPLIVALGDEVGDVLREGVSETVNVPLVLKDIVALCDTDKLVV